MKKGLLTLLLLIITTLPALAAPTNTSGPWGIDAGGFKNLSTALASPSTAGKTVVVSKPMAINNKTLPIDRHIKIPRGGSINPAAGKNFDFNSQSPEAGAYQIISGSGTVTGLNKADVEWFGALGNGTTNDRPAIIAAIMAVRAGGTVSLSNAMVSYKYDNSGGFTSAAVVDKSITLKIDSMVVGTTGGIVTANAPYIFKITADNVLVTGKGTIKFSGASDDTNGAYAEQDMPGFIWVTGNRVKISGLTFDTPPKTAIEFMGAWDGVVDGCKFVGGVPVYGGTALFGVRIYAGGRHKIINNYAGPDAGEKKIVTLVFSSGTTTGNLISGNHANGIYEKICYLYGDNNVVSNNYIIGPTVTAPYRVHGSGNIITGNRAVNCYGGAQITDGSNNSITNNTFTGCVQMGISVYVVAGYFGPISGTQIKGNILTGTGVDSAITQDGIMVVADTADASNISIAENTISGFKNTSAANSQAGIRLQGAPTIVGAFPYQIKNSKITNNIIEDGMIGISAIFNDGGDITGNLLKNQKLWAYNISSSTHMMVRGNSVKIATGTAWGANNGTTTTAFINNISSSSGVGISGTTPWVVPLLGVAVGTTTTLTVLHNGGSSGVTANTAIVLSGFTGADANLLNGQTVLASNYTLGGANDTFTVAINTVGKNITLGTATASSGKGNYGIGNQYGDSALAGKTTLTAAGTTLVTHGGVAANATIFVSPGNVAAGVAMKTKGVVIGISGTDFTIGSADGTLWTGTEIFNWQIVQ